MSDTTDSTSPHGTDENGNCLGCGKNHVEAAKEMWPDYIFAGRAVEHIYDNELYKQIPEGIAKWGEQHIEANMGGYVIQQQLENPGQPPKVGVENYASVMFELGFMFGALSGNRYDFGDSVPFPTEEEIETTYAEAKAERDARDSAGEVPDNILEFFREQGLIPDGADVSVVDLPGGMKGLAISKPGTPETGEQEGEAPGMYL